MDDVRAVMQAAGVERAALQGISEGGPASLLFAATYPDHVSARVIYGSTPRFSRADDFPWGIDEQENARSGRRSYRTSASGTHTRGNILATSIASDLSGASGKPDDSDDLAAGAPIYAAGLRLRALWTVWSVEVRVLSGASEKRC